jgi:hypothetical protein
MTTHQLATLLEHLQHGLGDALKSDTGKNFSEAVAAFRELPEQSLKEMVKTLKKVNSPESTSQKPKPNKNMVDLPAIIESIRAVRNGSAMGDLEMELIKMNNSQLKEVLKTFGQKPTTTTMGNLERAKQLCQQAITNGSHIHSGKNQHDESGLSTQLDMRDVEEGVRLFNELRDNSSLSIQEVRAGFARLRDFPKSTVEEISRQLKYTPSGSKKEILDRLISNLESLKMIQFRMDQILTGT